MALLHAILRARKKHEIYTHFDDEAEEMKKYCGLAIRRFHRQANLGWRERLSIEKKVGGSAIRQLHRQGDLGWRERLSIEKKWADWQSASFIGRAILGGARD